ncbi:double-strand break repair protein AddB [Aurantimonas endophytica]|uniref:ATP-dependent helicase/nuclease subunit B n=1 Tax=Aurantimonas endophytica TaxID=1522175 RepID=A0A7W6MRP6_9HYPH|nr:double-strand break repair protein AddB [Aurantimonas endophytica]MBB4005267.1 ATP-dependent helicase/nuclease subunit B [Aurantimonas endophytica]MCO6406071.1 double-strand break repair protein AddB [Aurantimonas endophytica]
MSANILSIPPGRPFLPTLADSLLAGRIVPSFTYQGDPLALADVTIYVPTRRAARALAGEFSRALGKGSAILPAIRPIGESDAADLFAAPQNRPTLLPVMDELTRRLHLARLARHWRTATAASERQALGLEAPVLPASAADALWLAGDLGTLLDEVETEAASLAGIAALAPDDLADWWRLTLQFLAIVTEHWPALLAAQGRVSEAAARNAWLRGEAERLRQGGARGPVILAGSTATAPATLELMHAIAHLEQGALVLPGLDRHLPPTAFDAIARDASIAAPGHPQYGLKSILDRFARAPHSVDHLGDGEDPALAAREAFVADALRPAETTDAWAEGSLKHGPEALDGMALIEAEDEREEAMAIACAMRDALADPEATTALITPDRNLARRVVSELSRFGIAANDSAGRPLSATAPGTLAATAIEVALKPGDPIALVALLKHPLTRLGMAPGDARRAARAIELIALRGSVGIADGARLAAIQAARRKTLEEHPYRAARPVRQVSAAERDLADTMAQRLEEALEPLVRLRSASGEIADYALAMTHCLEALARSPSGSADELYAGEAGQTLTGFLSGLVQAPRTGFDFAAAELPDVVAALMAGETVRPRGGLSARAFVWGTLEARLQHVDFAVLGGLNEGTWPAGARSGAFLSRVMRREIALDPPERRIGLSAHDFWMAMGTKRVILSRARRAGGAPAIASRWLQRLLTLAGAEGAARLVREGETYLAHARDLDRTEIAPRVARPTPRPPLADRPTRYRITDVETLIRDPYAIHARDILRLERLPELMRDPHAAERGNLFHDILGRYVIEGHDPEAEDAVAELLAIAREAFAAEALPADIEAVWWPRMETLATNYIGWERGRGAEVAERHAEIGGAQELPGLSTTLTGRADRIDRMRDGSTVIIDYKTGTTPSLSQARALLAPQLPLEGAMAKRGGFGEAASATRIADLVYVRLREREFYEDRLATDGGKKSEPVDPDALSEEAFAKLLGLAAAYRQETTPFTSRVRPFLAGDMSGPYDHLARAQEWAIGMDDAGEEGTS